MNDEREGWVSLEVAKKLDPQLLIDNLLHDNYPNFSTEEVNDWINNYYFRVFGARPPEKCIKPDEIIIKEKTESKGSKRKSLKITEEGRR